MTRLPGKLAGDRMYESTQDATWVHGIDLAQEADFDLGLLRVRPARCEVEWNGVSQTLQRRVMQVLVALAQARGSVVSQNDLVMRCWRGLVRQRRRHLPLHQQAPQTCRGLSRCSFRDRDYSRRRLSPHVAEPCRGRPRGESAAPHDRRFRLRALVAAAALAILVLAAATFWMVRGRAADDHHPIRVAVQPFETLSNSGDVRSLARRIPNEVVNALGDSQIEAVLAGEQAAKGTAAPGARADRDRDSARRRVATRLSTSGSRMAQPMPHYGRRNSSETAGKRRTCRWKLRRASPTW